MVDNVPANCVMCGLCRSAKSYKIPMEVHRPEGSPPWDPIDLHIVAEMPKSQEDHEGKPFVGVEGQFVREFLSCWEGSYAISYLARCSPPEGRGPTVEEIAACEPFLSEDFSNTTPQCIMLLGGAALKAVWKNGPTSVAKARMSPVKLGNTWIVTTYAPGMHTSGKQDLTQEYVRAFEMASKIVQGQFREHNPDVREARSTEDLGIVLRQIAAAPSVCVDIETDTHPKVPSKQTIYMPDAKLICMALGTTPEEPVWVLPAKMVNRQLLASFYGKTLLGSNIKYDINALAWWYDRDLWDHVSIEDTMLMHSSLDQGKAGNGLVDLCIRYLGIPDWKQPVWDMVRTENERLKRSKLPMTATLAHIPFPVVVEMNGKDVAFTMLLHRYLTQNKPARSVYQTLLLPATQFLGAGVELNGIGADPTMQRKILSAVETKIAQIQGMLNEQPEVKRIVNKLSSPYKEVQADGTLVFDPKPVKRIEFNSNSPVHLEHLLAQTDIEVDEKTEKATVWIDGVEVPKSKLDKKNIEKLGEANPVWRMVWKQREYRNLVSKFLVPYASHIAADGRVHCRYNVCKVEMGGESTGADSQSGGTDCVAAGTLVYAQRGLVPIESLFPEQPSEGFTLAHVYIAAYDGERMIDTATSALYFKKQRETVRVSLALGFEVVCTPEHPLMTTNGWIEAGQLTTEHKVLAPYGVQALSEDWPCLPHWEPSYHTNAVRAEIIPQRMSPQLARFLGYYVADGSYHDNNGQTAIRFTNSDPRIIEDISLLGRQLFGLGGSVVKDRGRSSAISFPSVVGSFVSSLVPGRKAQDKQVPIQVQQGSPDVWWGFLRGVFTDSTLDGSRPRCRFATANEQVARWVHVVLAGFGYVAGLRRSVEPRGIGYEFYTTLSGVEALVFLAQLDHVSEKHRNYREKWVGYSARPNRNVSVSRGCMDLPVKSVQPAGVRDVYDLTVPGVHSFIANGIVSHNTGRLAALDPPMHNLKKDEILRMMFNPSPGFLVAEYDYGQIEPRIMAWLAGCQSLIDACSESDLYRAMSAVMKGKRIVDVTDGERNLMKVGVLAALLYGQQVENFSRMQKVPLHEAQEFFKTCRQRFPEVPEYQQDVIQRARAGEEIPTVWGRSSTFGEMYREERNFGDTIYNQHIDIKAVNFTVQSPASDNTLAQGVRAYRIYKGFNFRFVNLVHDSHWAEIPIKTAEHFLLTHKNLMEDTSQFPFQMPVPTPVSVKYGRHLGAMVQWKPGEKVIL